MTVSGPCPLCHAWISIPEADKNEPQQCSFCNGQLFSTDWDTIGHKLEDLTNPGTNRYGELKMALHPVGTQVCRNCGWTHPASFSCCPKLVLLAIRSLKKTEPSEFRDAAFVFLKQHPDVTKNVLTGLVGRHKLTANGSLLTEILQRCGIELSHGSR